MTDEQRNALIAAAQEVRGSAYVPYSQYQVGAALLSADGNIYAGCNVENASYGLTICAERSAVASAVSAGRRDLVALALVTDGGKPPCGACRQVLAEFNQDLQIFLVDANGDGEFAEVTLGTLLPDGFKLSEK